jgi:hypothetical protein
MKLNQSLDCSGAYFAFNAAMECPVCFLCDAEIVDTSTMALTTRGKPLCVPCNQQIQEHMAANRAQLSRTLFSLLDPRESRASSMLRNGRPNIHE